MAHHVTDAMAEGVGIDPGQRPLPDHGLGLFPPGARETFHGIGQPAAGLVGFRHRAHALLLQEGQ